MFESIAHRSKAGQHDALKAYLEAPPQASVEDPLDYWNIRLQAGNPLAQMALDFLSIPCTSFNFWPVINLTYSITHSDVHGCRARFLARSLDRLPAASLLE